MDKGKPVRQSRFTPAGALGHRDHGAAGYDGIQVQVHSRVSQSLLWAGPCTGRTGLDMLHSLPGGFKFTRLCRRQGTQCPAGRAAGGRLQTFSISGTDDFRFLHKCPSFKFCHDEVSRRSRSGVLHAAVLCSLFHIFTHILISSITLQLVDQL